MKLSLFDKMIVPILLYGSEVWGIYGYKEIDKLHLKFCKRIVSAQFTASWVDVRYQIYVLRDH